MQVLQHLFAALCFLLIFVFIFAGLTWVLRPSGSQPTADALAADASQPTDLLFFGSSHIRRISNNELYQRFGLDSATVAYKSLTAQAALPLLQEAVSQYHPKVLVLSLLPFISGVSDWNHRGATTIENQFYNCVDTLPLGTTRAAVADGVLAGLNASPKLLAYNRSTGKLVENGGRQVFKGFNAINVQLDLLRNHSNWQDISYKYYKPDEETSVNRGCVVTSKLLYAGKPLPTSQVSYDLAGYRPFQQVLQYVEGLGIPVLLVDPPSDEANRTCQLGPLTTQVQSLQQSTPAGLRQVGIDPAQDFYNVGHLNLQGALAYSDYLGAYLQAHYQAQLPDRRGQAGYGFLDQDLATYNKKYKPKYEKQMAQALQTAAATRKQN
ncbi:MAG: hypothetical protein LBL67_01640 [Coriobacteriales bacterium]|jgi:hypothetical protein|nr:hypothetical protein [Coriobacteriales bacterium]